MSNDTPTPTGGQVEAAAKQTHYGCKLVAAHTGDGWSLEVHTREGEFLASLDWPPQWGEKNSEELTAAGFEVL